VQTKTGNMTSPRELHDDLVLGTKIKSKYNVALGRILYELKNKDKFKKAVGSGIDTWADYLKQPEIGLSVNEASRMIDIYLTFVVSLGYNEDLIAGIPAKNMTYLLPVAKKFIGKKESGDEELDMLIADATLLSQKDFKELLYDTYAEKVGDSATRTFEYFVMRRTVETNTLDRVMDISSDIIKETFKL